MGFVRRLGAGTAIFAGLFACSSYGDDPVVAPPANADAGPDAAIAPGPNDILYVSAATGDDARDGTVTSAALKTIGFALSRAKAIGAKEVHVCAGVYDESIVLDAPISLRGGYDCNTWQRPSGFGFPAFAGGQSETRLTRSGTTTDAITLTIANATVTRDTHVEGFTIEGPDQGVRGVAVKISTQASPSLHDVVVRGGHTKATNDSTGSVGIAIFEGASPEITKATISGGSGTTAESEGYGAVAVVIGDASPSLHDANINASDTPTISAGVVVSGAGKVMGTNALARLRVTTNASARLFAGIGSIGKDAEIEIKDCVVDTGVLNCTPDETPCLSAAISVAGAKKYVASGNRLAGGELNADRTNVGLTYGVFMTEVADALIVNNEISSGNERLKANVIGVGVGVAKSPQVRIVNNTIAIAPNDKATALSVIDHAIAAQVEGNLFVTTGNASGFFLDQCGEAKLGSLQWNAFVGFGDLAHIQRPGDCSGMFTAKSLKQLANGLPDTSLNGNVRVGPKEGCVEDNNACIGPATCSLTANCPGAILDGWTAPFRLGLVDPGWKLKPEVPCSVSKGVPSVLADATMDAFAIARTAPASIGAAENDTCAP